MDSIFTATDQHLVSMVFITDIIMYDINIMLYYVSHQRFMTSHVPLTKPESILYPLDSVGRHFHSVPITKELLTKTWAAWLIYKKY